MNGDLSEGGADKRLRTLIDEESKTNYIAQSYSQLEDYYKQHGLPQEADDVYIESKRIEPKRLSRIQRAYSWLLSSESWWFGRNYARVHRILGWIIVPIRLAAITGIIK